MVPLFVCSPHGSGTASDLCPLSLSRVGDVCAARGNIHCVLVKGWGCVCCQRSRHTIVIKHAVKNDDVK